MDTDIGRIGRECLKRASHVVKVGWEREFGSCQAHAAYIDNIDIQHRRDPWQKPGTDRLA